jgi:hypothetical protein
MRDHGVQKIRPIVCIGKSYSERPNRYHLNILSTSTYLLPFFRTYSLLARVARLTTTGTSSFFPLSTLMTGATTGTASTTTGAGSLATTALVFVFLT